MMESPARHWRARGEACLTAAVALPDDQPTMDWPVTHLLMLALECHLKAFLWSSRGGAPDTRDVSRLVTLARHCGLELAADELAAIAALCVLTSAPEPGGSGWQTARIASICRSIAEQIGE